MRYTDLKMKTGTRPERENPAARPGIALLGGGGRRGWKFAGRVLSLVLIMSLLLNSISWVVADDVVALGIETESVEIDEMELGGSTKAAVESENTYKYKLGKNETEILLSAIIEKLEMPLEMKDIEIVAPLGSDSDEPEEEVYSSDVDEPEDTTTELLYVEPLQQEDEIVDYRITVLKDFTEAGLMIYTEKDMYTVKLTEIKLEEDTLDLHVASGDGNTGDEPSGEDEEYTYALRDARVSLSAMLAEAGVPAGISDVESLAQMGLEDGSEALDVEQTGDDYIISARVDFDRVGLTVYTADSPYSYTIAITDGRVPSTETEQEQQEQTEAEQDQPEAEQVQPEAQQGQENQDTEKQTEVDIVTPDSPDATASDSGDEPAADAGQHIATDEPTPEQDEEEVELEGVEPAMEDTEPETEGDSTRISLTIKAEDKSKTYGDANPTFTCKIYQGQEEFNGTIENLTINYSLSRVEDEEGENGESGENGTNGESVGTYTITPSGETPQGNYDLTFQTGILTVEPATLTDVNVIQTGTLTYNGTAQTAVVESGASSINNKPVSFMYSSAEDGEYGASIPGFTNAGTHTVYYKATAQNHSDYNGSFNITIARKAATVTADAKGKTYGEADPALTATVDGTVEGDALNYTLARAAGENVGEYAITVTLGDNPNYDVTSTDGTFTISKKAATVTADAKGKTYGEADPALTATVDGTVEGDALNYTLARTEGENVGEYTITVTLGDNPNYAVTTANGTFTISKKTATVTADDKNKAYGDDDPELTATVEGLVGNDTLNYTLSRDGGEEVGTYTITPTGAAEQGNYDVEYETGTLTIGQAELTIKADDKEKTYGEADPDLTYKIMHGDTEITGTADELGITVDISRAGGENAGEYVITVSGPEQTDYYTFIYETGTLTIKPATVTLTANSDTKTYDGTEKTVAGFTCSVDGLTFTGVSASGSGTDAKDSPYPVSFTGVTVNETKDSTGNYVVSEAIPGTLTINPAPVTLTANSGGFVADGNPHAVSGYTASVSGLTFTGVSAESGNQTPPGTYSVEISGVTTSETKDTTGNYVVTGITPGVLVIFGQVPVTKQLKEFTGNLATYEIDVNPEPSQTVGYPLILKDTFSNNQSIDYSSVDIQPSGANVVYDYSDRTGTFYIPDGQHVTITYTTRVKGSAGIEVHFDNTAVLGVNLNGSFAEVYSTKLENRKTITPTGSDITGEGGVYAIRLYAYASGSLAQGLNGAEFRLLDYNQQPVRYQKGAKAGQQVTFTTQNDGYADITLTQEQHGVSIHKNTVYYLEMIKAPVAQNGDTFTYYQKDNTLYNFLITDEPNYQYGDVYSYFNGDVLKVRCYPESSGINVTKRFSGNYTLTDAQKNAITFVLEKENTVTGDWDEVERHAYSEFSWGSMNFNTGKGHWSDADYGATYRVREINADIVGVELNTTCVVSSQSQGKTVSEETNEFTVDPDQQAYSFSLLFTNEYFHHKLTIYALDEENGRLLSGVVMSAFKASEPENVCKVYTTGENGTTEIAWNEGIYDYNTLYYAVQTATKDGYLMPDEPEKVYFYFSKDSSSVPAGLPEGETALDLSKSFSTVAISNSSRTTHIPVIIAWGLTGAGTWPTSVDHVTVALYQSVDGGAAAPVEGKNPLLLNASRNYDNSSFSDLPVLDGNGKRITYSLVETIYADEGETQNVTREYAVSTNVSGSGWYVVRNQEAVSVTVKKEWYDRDGNKLEDTAGKPAITYDLYRATAELQATAPISREDLETHLASAELVRGGLRLPTSDNNWEETIYSLPRTDASDHLYYYFALEKSDAMPQNHEDSYVVVPATENAARTLTIRNTQTPTTVIIKAENCVKEYGESDPQFEFDITVQQDGASAQCGPDDENPNRYIITVTELGQSPSIITFTLDRQPGEDVGSYALVPKNVVQDGYRVKCESGALTINPAPVTIRINIPENEEKLSKTYGDADPVLVKVEGIKNGENASEKITYECYREPGEDVGEYPITISAARNQGNYTVDWVKNGKLFITRADATVTADSKDKEYGDEDPELTATVSGLKAGDGEGVIEYSLSRDPGLNAGSYKISITGNEDQGNYHVSFIDTDDDPNILFNITRAPVTVTADDLEKVYGDEDPQLTATVQGLKNGDAESIISYTLSRNEGDTVGDYTITAFGEERQGNYAVTYINGILTILPAELTVTPEDKVKGVNDEDPELTATVEGLKNGDAESIISYTLSRNEGDAVGDYTITASGEERQGNYVITYETGVFSILSVYNIDISQAFTDQVNPGAATPEYTYVAEVDLTGTGLTSLPGFQLKSGRVYMTTFGLPGSGTTPNLHRLQIPVGAKLTVAQQPDTAPESSRDLNYATSMTLDGEPHEETNAEGQPCCTIDSVDDYYAIQFVHTRVCLPVQAMAGVDKMEEGAEKVNPMRYLGIPAGEQLIDAEHEPALKSGVGYVLPTDKNYVFDHGALYSQSENKISDVIAVKYDTDNKTWLYKNDNEYLVVRDGAVLRMYYYPKYICKIDGEKYFTLNEAMSHVQEGTPTTIQLLIDSYDIPGTDALTIPANYDITITTAAIDDEDREGSAATATITRSDGFTGSIFTNNGTLTLDNIILDGNGANVKGADAMVSNTGVFIVNDTATLQNADGVNGGALYNSNGTATINGTIAGNNATRGGAAYISGGTVEIPGGALSGNTAASGGAVFMIGGTLDISGGTVGGASGGNSATNGGAIYMEAGTVNVSDGSILGNTATQDGGALYATGGKVNVSGGIIRGNTATDGNGGAICYTGPGTVTVSGGTLSGNTANNGFGGAIYQSGGTVNITNTTQKQTGSDGKETTVEVRRSYINDANKAKNGSAIFVEQGIANFGTCEIKNNRASEGGAVGVGETARLYFSGDVTIKDNYKATGTNARNVYLDKDSDEIINVPAAGLGSKANIKVYVADNVRNTRGEVCCSFGAYVGTVNLTKFQDDRSVYSVYSDSNKLFWGKPIKFKVRYLPDGFPPNTGSGSDLYGSTTYYPRSTENPIYSFVANLSDEYYNSKIEAGYVYSYTYETSVTGFEKYLTAINWDSVNRKWIFQQHDNTSQSGKTDIVIYYSDAAYLSITNNSGKMLTIDTLTVMGKNAVTDGYGYIVAINNVTQTTLIPITAEKLVIPNEGSVRLLFPGAKNKEWIISGKFEDAFEGYPIEYTLNGEEKPSVEAGAEGEFELSGNQLLSYAGGIYDVLFGEPTPICKVENGGEEHPFPVLTEAMAYITSSDTSLDTPFTATIQMLMDYQQPKDDILNIPEGYKITLTTAAAKNSPEAVGKTYTYVGDDSTRATISRRSGEVGSAIKAQIQDGTAVFTTDAECTTSLTVNKIIFDGKALGEGGQGGAINTSNVIVNIDDCVFRNYIASRGGAVYTKWGQITVSNTNFNNCKIISDEDKTGGGGIWSTAKVMTVEHCNFTNCSCEKAQNGSPQGGAVFHNIRYDGAIVHLKDEQKFPSGFSNGSSTYITDCKFRNCTARGSGGTVESDAWLVYVRDCEFHGSKTLKSGGNGGAINIYTNDNQGIPASSLVEVENCTFEDCEAPNGNTNGGAIRTISKNMIVKGCSFKNVRSNHTGGAISMTTTATRLEVHGSTFENCSAGNNSGAICAKTKTVVIDDTYTSYTGTATTKPSLFTNCTAPSYGCIYQSLSDNGSEFSVENTSFEDCSSTISEGGALYVKAKTLSITGRHTEKDFTFKNCTAAKDGGAVYHSGSSEALSNCIFDSCASDTSGGGAYLAATNTLTMNGVEVKNCRAVKDGGGLFVSPLKANITGCSFADNRVTDSNNVGGALFINKGTVTMNNGSVTGSKAAKGGGIYQNGTLNLNGTTISGCYASLEGGGLYNAETVNGYGSIIGCFAKKGGGVYSKGALNFADPTNSMTIQNCHAKTVTIGDDGTASVAQTFTSDNLGGGVYNETGAFTSSNATITECHAYDGGGVYQIAGSIALSGGSVTQNDATNNGGGVYQAGGSFSMNGANRDITITGNNARRGAGVFVANGQTMSVNAAKGYRSEISGNHARIAGGGIAVGGSESIVKFAGCAIVQNNTQGTDNTTCNIYLDQDSNTVIQTTSDALNANAYIGVYAADDQESDHGVPGKPFGTRVGDANLDRFNNDRRQYIRGGKGPGSLIIWSDFVCKITDANGNLLYTDTNGSPAVYTELSGAFGALNVSGNPTLYPAEETDAGNTYTGDYQIQMLVQNYPISQQIALSAGNRKITLTTASTTEDECGFKYKGDQKHPYAAIERSASYGSMFKLSSGELTLSNIIIDGGYDPENNRNIVAANDTNGGIMYIEGSAKATIGNGATLRNSRIPSNKGGAGVRLQSDASQLVLDGGTITGCSGSQWGGAVSVKGGTFTMKSGSITNCSSLNGGAVRVDTYMYMSGGSITGNTATINGGGVSAENDTAKLYFSGDAVVQGNYLNDKTCNVQLSRKSVEVIYVDVAGLGENARIGVYTEGTESDRNSLYYNHGRSNMPFGTWTANDDNLYCFINDVNGLQGGRKDLESTSADRQVYWVGEPLIVVKKAVSSDWSQDGQIEFPFTVELHSPNNDPLPSGLNVFGFDKSGKLRFTLKADGNEEHSEKSVMLPIKLHGFGYTVTEELTEAQQQDYSTTVKKTAGSTEYEETAASSIAGVLGEDDAATSELFFTNTRVHGQLTISKSVLSKVEEDSTKPFHFVLTLDDMTLSKSYPCYDRDGNPIDGDLEVTDGVAEFDLSKDESITIKDLPKGLGYTVEEVMDPADAGVYRTRVSKNGGNSIAATRQTGAIGEVSETATDDDGNEITIFTSSADFINNRLETVCKITRINSDGEKELLRYWDNDTLVPAVYFRLEDAFAQINRGGLRTSEDGSVSGKLHIEMLVPEYEMEEPAVLNRGKNVVLTTASTTDSDSYPYRGEEDSAAVVGRGYNGDSMIIDNGTLTLESITLDGGAADFTSTGNGGIVNLATGNASLTVENEATLRNSVADNNGGAIWMESGSKLTMNGTISGCSATRGGGVYASAGFKTIALGGTISDCTANNGGAIYASTGTSVTINTGAALTGNRATSREDVENSGCGGAIYSAANVVVRGGSIGEADNGNTAAKDGGGIYLDAGAAFTMSGGAIAGNAAETGNGGGLVAQGTTRITGGSFATNTAVGTGEDKGEGGAIYTASTATVTISGSTTAFTGNQARLGGAIYDDGNVIMTGGKIGDAEASGSANSATEAGGAVYVADGKRFAISGGGITGNSSPQGAVSTGESAVLSFSGNARITGNTADDPTTPMNVYLGYDSNIIINSNGLGSNANIGVYVADGVSESILNEHGISDRNFGTYAGSNPTSANVNNMSRFVNDRDDALHGMIGEKQEGEGDRYYIMWEGKDLILDVRRFDIRMTTNDDGVSVPVKDGDGKYIPAESLAAVKGATFTLTNIHDANTTDDDVEVWTGSSDANGRVTVPWGMQEADSRVRFAPGSTYLLKQTATANGCVLPAGCWTLTIGQDNVITWVTVQGDTVTISTEVPGEEPTEETRAVNRTIDIGKLSENAKLGETFTLYNDRQPTIIFHPNGNGDRPKTYPIGFDSDDLYFDYTIAEKNPTWNTLFKNWATAKDPGSGDDYYKYGDVISFCRKTDYDDVTLYAQWVKVVCKITDRNDNLLYIDGDPCIYGTLWECFEDYNSTTKKYTTQDGKTAHPNKIKMLVQNYAMEKPVTLARGKTVTLTTASRDDTDGYPYTGAENTVCTITRGAFEDTGASMITNRFNLTLTDITLDGGAKYVNNNNTGRTATGDGGIVTVDGSYAVLTLREGAKLQNSAVTGNGGAVYSGSGTTVNVSGGAIIDNRAGIDGNGNGGGIYALGKVNITGGDINGNHAINGAGVYCDGGLTVSDSSAAIYGNIASGNGGGVYVAEHGTLTMSAGQIGKDGQANEAANGGGMYLNGSASLTGGSITANTALKQTDVDDSGKGGGVYSAAGMTLEGASIKDNQASLGGGAYIAAGKTVAMSGGTVSGNAATDGAGLYVDGGALTLSGGTIGGATADDANAASGNGGGLYVSGGTATLSGGEIRGNSAMNGAGVYLNASAEAATTATLSGATISGNAASGNGGGLYVDHYSDESDASKNKYSTLTVASGSVTGNSATNGAGVYVNSGTVATQTDPAVYGFAMSGGAISGNEAGGNGGGLYVNEGTAAISGGSVTDNRAVVQNGVTDSGLGGAVYMAAGKAFEMSGGSVTGNGANGTNGGAINVDGASARLYFSGNPIVYGNPKNAAVGEQKNVVLSVDSNEVINTTGSGLTGGAIGVYVIDGSDGAIFTAHGKYGTPFGTFGDSKSDHSDAMPGVFMNDREPVLFGVSKPTDDPEYGKIFWMEPVCKLTGDDGTLLYRNEVINGSTVRVPAVYASLEAAFVDAGKVLRYRDGDGYKVYVMSRPIRVELLKDIDQSVGIEFATARNVTLTTALTEIDSEKTEKDGDVYVYKPAQGATGERTTRATITRKQATAPMFTFSTRRTLTVTGLIVDGNLSIADEVIAAKVINGGAFDLESVSEAQFTDVTICNFRTIGNGGAIHLKKGELKLETGALITGNSATNGGAVYVGNGGAKLTVTDAVLAGNSAIAKEGEEDSGRGGAVYLAAAGNESGSTAGTMTMTDGTIGSATINETAIAGNSAANGGAVYAANGASVTLVNGSKIVSGSAVPTHATISGNKATTDGAGIYLDEGGKLFLSGSPDFGGADVETEGEDKDNIKGKSGNFLEGADYTDKTNGQKTYVKPRQDIFVKGFDNAEAQSIVVTGTITSGDGTIWVWAGEKEHYEMLQQFAILDTKLLKTVNGEQVVNTARISQENLLSTMHAFRNARPDGETGCGADYLTGQTGEKASCIYWTGGFDFAFQKIKGDGAPLNGAKFKLYMANDDGTGIKQEGGVNVAYQQTVNGVKADATAESMAIAAADAVTIKELVADTSTNPATEKAVDRAVYGAGLVAFRKIPPGTYFLVEYIAPKLVSGDTSENPLCWQGVEQMYRIELKGDGTFTISVANGTADADGNPTWTSVKDAPTTLFVKGDDGKYTAPEDAVAQGADTQRIFTAMNISPIARKVILRKVGTGYTTLPGAKFTVYYADRQTVVKARRAKKDSNGNPVVESYALEDLTSGDGGAFFIGQLPLGTYYLKETAAPSGYAVPSHWFVLEVTAVGVTPKELTESTESLPASATP